MIEIRHDLNTFKESLFSTNLQRARHIDAGNPDGDILDQEFTDDEDGPSRRAASKTAWGAQKIRNRPLLLIRTITYW